VFEYKEVPEEKKVKIIVVKLKKHGSLQQKIIQSSTAG
jgi:hypothetical protein